MIKGKPFVKWAGGKRQIIDILKKYVPDEFNTYYEPFVGGGALLFELSPKKAVINDSNKELMNVYECIKDAKKFELMCRELNHHETEHSEEYYYQIRNLDRDKKKYQKIIDYKRAARTIYLNKACFNGLYRVNRKGYYNVPFGKHSKPTICDTDNLLKISETLQNVTMRSCDYHDVLNFADENTFVYIDPPYRPLNATSGFTSYTEDQFNDQNQIELADVYQKLTAMGAKVMLSNSDPHNVDENDNFFDDLYADFTILRVDATRVINSKASSRGKIKELLIKNY